jgi:diguanylate cyclase (GGDEF)-like protein
MGREDGRGPGKEFEFGSEWYSVPRKAERLSSTDREAVEPVYHRLMAGFLGRQMAGFNKVAPKDGIPRGEEAQQVESDLFMENVKGLESSVWAQAMEAYRAERELAIDKTTGLFNKDAFAVEYEAALNSLNEAGEEDEVMVFIHFDIDFFRQINEKIKHHSADKVLREIGEKIKGTLRPFDRAGRTGGDEFEIILNHVDANKVNEAIERILSAINSVVWSGEGEKISVSAGAHVISSGDNPYFAAEQDVTDMGAYISKFRDRDGYTMVNKDREHYTFYKNDRDKGVFEERRRDSGKISEFRVTLNNCKREVESALQRSLESINSFFEEEEKKGKTGLSEYMKTFYKIDSGDIKDLTLKQIAELLFLARNNKTVAEAFGGNGSGKQEV